MTKELTLLKFLLFGILFLLFFILCKKIEKNKKFNNRIKITENKRPEIKPEIQWPEQTKTLKCAESDQVKILKYDKNLLEIVKFLSEKNMIILTKHGNLAVIGHFCLNNNFKRIYVRDVYFKSNDKGERIGAIGECPDCKKIIICVET